MNTRIKSISILVGTLLTGAILGGVIVGLVARDRSGKIQHIHRPGGFVEHMQHVIQPTDDEQWEQIRPVIEGTGSRHRQIITDAHAALKGSFDSMVVSLEPLLGAEQIQRLKDEHVRMLKKGKRKKGKGRRGRPGPPGGPPPDGPPPDGLPPEE